MQSSKIYDENRKDVARNLRYLPVNKIVTFPLIQYTSVVNSIQRFQKQYKSLNWRFSYQTTDVEIIVTRTAGEPQTEKKIA